MTRDLIMGYNDGMKDLRGQLADMLYAYSPSDVAEVGYHEKMLALVEQAEDPITRELFDPGHFTASSFVVSPERDALLLIYSEKFTIWVQPGGHIDADDPSPVHAALRELAEETGLFMMAESHEWPIFDVDIHKIPANDKKQEPPHRHYDIRFLFEATTTRLAPGAEVRDARWVPFEKITEDITDRSVVRAVEKIRKG